MLFQYGHLNISELMCQFDWEQASVHTSFHYGQKRGGPFRQNSQYFSLSNGAKPLLHSALYVHAYFMPPSLLSDSSILVWALQPLSLLLLFPGSRKNLPRSNFALRWKDYRHHHPFWRRRRRHYSIDIFPRFNRSNVCSKNNFLCYFSFTRTGTKVYQLVFVSNIYFARVARSSQWRHLSVLRFCNTLRRMTRMFGCLAQHRDRSQEARHVSRYYCTHVVCVPHSFVTIAACQQLLLLLLPRVV